MELLTERVHIVERKHREGRRMRVLRYGLFCDRTSHGASSYYVKALSQVWDGQTLVREELETSGGLGDDRPQAMEIMAQLCETRSPVLPQHVVDIVRDITGDPEHRPFRRGPAQAAPRPRRGRVVYLDPRYLPEAQLAETQADETADGPDGPIRRVDMNVARGPNGDNGGGQ
ncbi:MAG: hypothetical protein ACYC6V_06870 [Bacillota bacterium]